MKFGLKQTDITYIIKAISLFPEITKVVIFGSRAMGNYKSSSDIDICLKGVNVSLDTMSSLQGELQDKGPLPYQVDIIHYETIESQDLIQHIDEFGVSLSEEK